MTADTATEIETGPLSEAQSDHKSRVIALRRGPGGPVHLRGDGVNSPERSGGQWTPRPPPAFSLAFGPAPRRSAEAPARWSKLAIDHGKSPSTTTLLLCGLLVSCETASTTTRRRE